MATKADQQARVADGASSPWRAIAALLRHPADGWRDIAATSMATGALFAGVAAPLAAIGPAARMIHALAFGSRSMGIIEYRPTPAGAIVTALAGWIAALVAVCLLAVAIDAAAPWFGGTRDRSAAAKVAVFGCVPWWVASGFAILPGLGVLQVIGLYSLILLFAGAPLAMRADGERGVFHGLATIAAAVALLIASLIVPAAIGRGSLRPTVETANGREEVTGAPAIPDSNLVAPANDKKHAVAPGIATAVARGAVDPNSLQALLPDRVGGFVRTALENQSNLSAGTASADAKATYVQDTNSFTLTIADAGAPGALATSDSVIAGEVNRSTDSGYQRSRVVNGVRITEKWSNADHGGSHSRTVAGRFTVEAQGTAPTIDTLRQAVASVDEARLAGLAR